MKYALYTGLYDPLLSRVLTGSLVPDYGDVLIDFNAVSLSEFGQPETLLDYIDRELVAEEQKAEPNRSYISSIESFRDMIADPDPDNGFFLNASANFRRTSRRPIVSAWGWNRWMPSSDL